MTYRDRLAAEWPELAHVLATEARAHQETDATHETAAYILATQYGPNAGAYRSIMMNATADARYARRTLLAPPSGTPAGSDRHTWADATGLIAATIDGAGELATLGTGIDAERARFAAVIDAASRTITADAARVEIAALITANRIANGWDR